MVIDYQKFPILEMLEQDQFNEKCIIKTFDLPTDKKSFLGVFSQLIKNWTYFVKAARWNITIISEPYYQCMKRSWESFKKINLKESIKPTSGCLILKSENRHWMSLIYIVRSVSDMEIICLYDCDTFCFVADGSYGNLRCIATSDEGIYSGLPRDEVVLNMCNVLICFLLMDRYAKVETKTCLGKTKIKNESVEKGKVLNLTNLSINFKDSTWFTTICRNEGFKVRGHFRLQPKKNDKGEWVKELIYINEFEKHGYHRQAKILNQ